MVSTASLIFMAISTVIAFGLPIGLAIFFYKRENKISISAIFIGALIFIVFQLLTRIPMLSWLNTQEWYIELASNTLFISLFLGLTAGLFEEVGRFVAFKYLMKRNLSWKNGVAYGIGHGGIEAMLLLGLTYINYIIYSVLINSGTFDALIGSKVPALTASMIKTQLTGMAPYTFALGGIERVMAIIVQIALSLVVLYGVMNRKNIYLLYAIILHAVLDSPIVVFSKIGLSPLLIEGYVLLCAVAAVIYIVKSKKIFKESSPPIYIAEGTLR